MVSPPNRNTFATSSFDQSIQQLRGMSFNFNTSYGQIGPSSSFGSFLGPAFGGAAATPNSHLDPRYFSSGLHRSQPSLPGVTSPGGSSDGGQHRLQPMYGPLPSTGHNLKPSIKLGPEAIAAVAAEKKSRRRMIVRLPKEPNVSDDPTTADAQVRARGDGSTDADAVQASSADILRARWPWRRASTLVEDNGGPFSIALDEDWLRTAPERPMDDGTTSPGSLIVQLPRRNAWTHVKDSQARASILLERIVNDTLDDDEEQAVYSPVDSLGGEDRADITPSPEDLKSRLDKLLKSPDFSREEATARPTAIETEPESVPVPPSNKDMSDRTHAQRRTTAMSLSVPTSGDTFAWSTLSAMGLSSPDDDAPNTREAEDIGDANSETALSDRAAAGQSGQTPNTTWHSLGSGFGYDNGDSLQAEDTAKMHIDSTSATAQSSQPSSSKGIRLQAATASTPSVLAIDGPDPARWSRSKALGSSDALGAGDDDGVSSTTSEEQWTNPSDEEFGRWIRDRKAEDRARRRAQISNTKAAQAVRPRADTGQTFASSSLHPDGEYAFDNDSSTWSRRAVAADDSRIPDDEHHPGSSLRSQRSQLKTAAEASQSHHRDADVRLSDGVRKTYRISAPYGHSNRSLATLEGTSGAQVNSVATAFASSRPGRFTFTAPAGAPRLPSAGADEESTHDPVRRDRPDPSKKIRGNPAAEVFTGDSSRLASPSGKPALDKPSSYLIKIRAGRVNALSQAPPLADDEPEDEADSKAQSNVPISKGAGQAMSADFKFPPPSNPVAFRRPEERVNNFNGSTAEVAARDRGNVERHQRAGTPAAVRRDQSPASPYSGFLQNTSFRSSPNFTPRGSLAIRSGLERITDDFDFGSLALRQPGGQTHDDSMDGGTSEAFDDLVEELAARFDESLETWAGTIMEQLAPVARRRQADTVIGNPTEAEAVREALVNSVEEAIVAQFDGLRLSLSSEQRKLASEAAVKAAASAVEAPKEAIGNPAGQGGSADQSRSHFDFDYVTEVLGEKLEAHKMDILGAIATSSARALRSPGDEHKAVDASVEGQPQLSLEALCERLQRLLEDHDKTSFVKQKVYLSEALEITIKEAMQTQQTNPELEAFGEILAELTGSVESLAARVNAWEKVLGDVRDHFPDYVQMALVNSVLPNFLEELKQSDKPDQEVSDLVAARVVEMLAPMISGIREAQSASQLSIEQAQSMAPAKSEDIATSVLKQLTPVLATFRAEPLDVEGIIGKITSVMSKQLRDQSVNLDPVTAAVERLLAKHEDVRGLTEKALASQSSIQTGIEGIHAALDEGLSAAALDQTESSALLLHQLSKLHEKISSMDQSTTTVEELRRELSASKAEVAAAKEALQSSEQMCSTLGEELVQLEEISSQATAQLRTLQEQESVRREELKNAQVQAEKQATDTRTREDAGWKAKIDVQNQALLSRVSELLDELRTSRQSSAKEKEEYETRVNELLTRLKRSEEAQAAMKQEMARRAEESLRSHQELEKELKAASQRAAFAEDENDGLEKRVAEQDAKLATVVALSTTQKHKLAEQQQKIAESDRDRLEEQVAQLALKTSLLRDKEALEVKLRSAEAAQATLKTEIEDYHKRYVSFEEELVGMKGQFVEREALEARQSELNAVKEENSHLRIQVKEGRDTIRQLVAKSLSRRSTSNSASPTASVSPNSPSPQLGSSTKNCLREAETSSSRGGTSASSMAVLHGDSREVDSSGSSWIRLGTGKGKETATHANRISEESSISPESSWSLGEGPGVRKIDVRQVWPAEKKAVKAEPREDEEGWWC